MRSLRAALGAAMVVFSLALPTTAAAQDPSIAAAGDIACTPSSVYYNGGAGTADRCRHRYTSDLLVNAGFSAVLALGDTQYESGEYANFQTSYNPTWGRVKQITRPAIGNHEYHPGSGSPAGTGYFDYFNGPGQFSGPAGDRDKGYYSFDVGAWHLIALNSVCDEVDGCHEGSPQEQWLREDLFRNRRACTLAYWHHATFSSGDLGNHNPTRPLFKALHDAGAEVVLTGHDHNYERFAPQDATGRADPAYGVRAFVVGTGGKDLRALGIRRPNSEALQNTAHGVLALTLQPRGYAFRFLPAAGSSYADSGNAGCHGGPPTAFPAAATVRASTITDRVIAMAGTVNPRGQPTEYRFDYGRSRRLGRSTPAVRVAGGNQPTERLVTSVLRVRPRRKIHYRLVATNAAGTSYGPRRTATTFARRGAYARSVIRTFGLAAYFRMGERRGRRAIDEMRTWRGRYRGRYRLKRRGAIRGDGNTAVGTTRGEVSFSSQRLGLTGSLEGWFLWRRGSTLMRDSTKGAKAGWILAYDDGGRLSYRVAGKSFKTRLRTAEVQGRWRHFALVKNGASTALYVNGRRVHRGRRAPNRVQRGSWHVMRNGTHRGYAAGGADEIAVYTTPISGRTVRRHFRLRGRR